MKRRFGFTLIELVMVIVILGILAGVTLPKFVNFKTRAIERSEDVIAGALNTALKIYEVSYIAAGGDPNNFPAWNPFTLLEQAPPYAAATSPLVPDGVTWHYCNTTGLAVYIHCPHRDGDPSGGGTATYGRYYIYQYKIYSPGWGKQPGDFWLWSDKGH